MEKQYYNPEIWGGIECTINRVNDVFNDQLIFSKHYERTTDIDAIADLGIKKIRYPVLWEKHQPTIDVTIDWSWIRRSLQQLQEKNIDVIAGLVHHGSGPSFTNLLDKNFPFLLAQYAKQVAQEFPWINYYTPVNEPLTTARFSGLYGLWYPHCKDDRSFMLMLLNEMKATVLSLKAIREINPLAKLVQTEDLGKTYSTEKLKYQAEFENERRWLTYDLLCGRVDNHHPLWSYLQWLKIPEEELIFFQENICVPDVFGFNHYVTSERFLDDRIELYPNIQPGGNGRHQYVDVEAVRVKLNEPFGLEVLLKEAWQRYHKPIAITEVHLHCHREEQLRWFYDVWNTCKKVIEEGVNVEAVTAWALLGSFGWNKLLTQPGGDYEQGVFDCRNGTLRPTALARLIKEITKAGNHLHSIAGNKGWWKREDRFYHPSLSKTKSLVPSAMEHLVLIIGKTGTLGRGFARVCDDRCLSYYLIGRDDCDITSLSSIEKVIDLYKPWCIINAAGYVRVDDAENDCDNCYRSNTTGPHYLAIAAKKAGVKLVSFSSDLVFDGEKRSAYVEDDLINPLNTYGKSKANAEMFVLNEDPSSLIIRTSAFFGPWDEYNFVHYVRRSLLQAETIQVVKDITISPTYVPDLVHAALDLILDDEKGIWHLANDGEITWADLAYEIADRFDLNRKYINAVPYNEMNFIAPRPRYSVLSSKRGIHLPSLENGLRRYANDEIFFSRNKINTRRA